jgi:hypothetical protein
MHHCAFPLLRLVPLNQFHFHSPSEHTINGVHYPLEMHMVHKLFQASLTNTTIVPSSASSPFLAKAAVIGVMFAYEFVDACCRECTGLTLPDFSLATALRMQTARSWRS